MKIGIDIDGVILDFERTMNTYAELYDLLILGKSGVVNKDKFSYLEKYDWSVAEKNDFVKNYLVYATINSTPFIPLAKEMIKFFELEGYEYEFITARGSLVSETKEAIITLFNNNGIDTTKIRFMVNDKVRTCINLNIDIMIDDNPNICKKLRDNKIKTLYFRDKNSENLIENEYLKEVSNVGEIIRFIVDLDGLKRNRNEYEKILKNNRY